MAYRGTVFIVDDKSYIIDLLSTVLQEEGYVVRSSTDGEAALTTIATYPPDIILLDLVMPGMSGLDVLSALRSSRFAHIPVILMSAHPLQTINRHLYPAAAVLDKPFDLDELFDCIDRTIRKPIPSYHKKQSIIQPKPNKRVIDRKPAYQDKGNTSARNPDRQREVPVTLMPLVHPDGLALPLQTLERIVASLDYAIPQKPSTVQERWRYRFSWEETAIVVVGGTQQSVIFGTDRFAMSRLAEVITARSLEIIQIVWPRVDVVLHTTSILLKRYDIDVSVPWAFRPHSSSYTSYRYDLKQVLKAFALLDQDGLMLLQQMAIRQGTPCVFVWLKNMLDAYRAGEGVYLSQNCQLGNKIAS
ncbi:MAG: response regulator [Chloroflexota bacterium]